MTEILLSGFISEEDQGRCDIHGSLSNKGDFFIALESNNTSEDYCMKLSEKLANVLNNPTQMGTTSSDSVSVSIPQVIYKPLAKKMSLFHAFPPPPTHPQK